MIVLILVILILAAAEVGIDVSGEKYCAAMQLVIWRGRIREELRTV